MTIIIKEYIWAVWDILGILIVARFVFVCARRGFVSTVVGLFIYIGATLAALRFNRQFASFLYENVVYGIVKGAVSKRISELLGGPEHNILMAVPHPLRALIANDQAAQNPARASGVEMIASDIIDLVLEAPLNNILGAVSFLILFALAALFIRWLSGFFTGINNLPVIGALNTVLGGAAGAAEGVLTLLFTGVLLKLAVTVSGGSWWWLNAEVIGGTYIWRHFY